MKINGTNQVTTVNPYKKAVEMQQPAATLRTGKKDQVEISSEAKVLLESLTKKSPDTAELRRGRIEELKQAVQSGTYTVDSKKLAERMLPYLT